MKDTSIVTVTRSTLTYGDTPTMSDDLTAAIYAGRLTYRKAVAIRAQREADKAGV